MDPEILEYYDRGKEESRLRQGVGRLEFWRTQDILRRVLPAPHAGLTVSGQYGVEGAVGLMGGVETYLDDSAKREAVLDALRIVESDPALLGVSSHLLTAARV